MCLRVPLLTRYAVAWVYLAAFVSADIVVGFLSPASRLTAQQWASTNVANLRHDPLGSLIVSAFVPTGYDVAWPFLIAMAMFGANRALGNWRTAVVCGTGHVLGTLVSEGILAYRIAHGLLPESESRVVDVGPSYVVVAAMAVAVLHAPWAGRIVAAVDLLLLVVVGGIFSGLSTLQVAAVGHTTSIVVAAILGSVLAWQLRHAQATATHGNDTSPGGLASHASSRDINTPTAQTLPAVNLADRPRSSAACEPCSTPDMTSTIQVIRPTRRLRQIRHHHAAMNREGAGIGVTDDAPGRHPGQAAPRTGRTPDRPHPGQAAPQIRYAVLSV